jgi:predicted transglutaminase-like cysteine proteinase
MNAVNAAATEAKANTDTKMPITRLQSKKMNAVNASATEANTKANLTHGIDFIDASIEWRMNKITYGNCTFEYIWI